MDDLKNLIGHRLKAYREQKELSQAKLSELAGCHPTYIGQLERGEKNATLIMIWKISSALDVPLSQLFENIEDSGPTEQSIPSKCYELMIEKNTKEQEKLFKILEEISGYGK